MIGRVTAIASQMTQISRITDKNEIRDPIEETTFHIEKASG
jgi:hypothetical protein